MIKRLPTLSFALSFALTFAFFGAFLTHLAPTLAETLDGEITHFADADSFFINQVEVRLSNIDSFELYQHCQGVDRVIPCGKLALDFMRQQFGEEKIRCRIITVDRFERFLSTCRALKSRKDLSAALVSAGWALATSKTYRSFMRQAQAECRGVWQDSLPLHPKTWRKQTSKLRTYDPRLYKDPAYLGQANDCRVSR